MSEGVSKTSRTGCEQDLERTSEKDLKVSLRSPENDVKDVPNEGSASDFNGAEKNVEKRRKNFYESVVKIQQSERSDVNDRRKNARPQRFQFLGRSASRSDFVSGQRLRSLRPSERSLGSSRSLSPRAVASAVGSPSALARCRRIQAWRRLSSNTFPVRKRPASVAAARALSPSAARASHRTASRRLTEPPVPDQ